MQTVTTFALFLVFTVASVKQSSYEKQDSKSRLLWNGTHASKEGA